MSQNLQLDIVIIGTEVHLLRELPAGRAAEGILVPVGHPHHLAMLLMLATVREQQLVIFDKDTKIETLRQCLPRKGTLRRRELELQAAMREPGFLTAPGAAVIRNALKEIAALRREIRKAERLLLLPKSE